MGLISRCSLCSREAGSRANDHLLPSSYRLLQLIGKGSYGRVFRARDVSSNQLVAVKVIELPPGEQSFGEDVRRPDGSLYAIQKRCAHSCTRRGNLRLRLCAGRTWGS